MWTSALGFPIFANPFWVWQIWRAARRFRPDCMIVRDLPLAPAVLQIGRALGIPVHYEMADVYPIALRANRAAHPGLGSRLARNAAIAEAADRVVIRGAASVFVVSEESRARCLAIGFACNGTRAMRVFSSAAWPRVRMRAALRRPRATSSARSMRSGAM